MEEMTERLKGLRKENNLTQNDVAVALGIKRTAYQAYESGRVKASPEILVKLSNLFGCTVDYITGRPITLWNTFDEQFDPANKKDTHDIAKGIEELLNSLESTNTPIKFNGAALDDNTRNLLISSLKNSMAVGDALLKKGK